MGELKKVETEKRVQAINVDRVESPSKVDWSFSSDFVLSSNLFTDLRFSTPLKTFSNVEKADSPNNIGTFYNI